MRFEVTARPQNSQIPESDPESSSLGVIFLTDVFPANDTVLDGEGDGVIEVTGMVSRNIYYNITRHRSQIDWNIMLS